MSLSPFLHAIVILVVRNICNPGQYSEDQSGARMDCKLCPSGKFAAVKVTRVDFNTLLKTL
jgi:hypothetical protein